MSTYISIIVKGERNAGHQKIFEYFSGHFLVLNNQMVVGQKGVVATWGVRFSHRARQHNSAVIVFPLAEIPEEKTKICNVKGSAMYSDEHPHEPPAAGPPNSPPPPVPLKNRIRTPSLRNT